ncbi:Inosine/uridine-preferring nucleoside hydrolase domain protein [Cordyceps fumosorosea ARSEF 2679]|uniref:Inosine/uridine-preferring nucleoside hydrolase domain protein n=1 Tax=Cordyceps fumosorosea (strain ARSEF 2679) TaxID=1081104 RepID=A0A168E2X1_CORFA|nr:Inosine/uridine-preferring nucleoside hydrolase domain protein [Cordyceps fumosorosea ARSEF 2679]OAA73313.1 Inosine/uridine-preferring nucleoside hydrolase domain protein [Cordyceps fumosorosea ARSEF 2679]
MAPRKIIIDTDPGVDDILAMLLALSASKEELEVIMISVTYGNVPLECCGRNVVGMMQVIEKEMAWRKANGRPEGFESLKACKPLVALGAEHPLEETDLKYDHFHGLDGLHNVHSTFPDFSPPEKWLHIFREQGSSVTDLDKISPLFTPSREPAHKEMLRLLRENPVDSITILTVGPTTNAALAASEDPEAFLRAREVVVMGGAVRVQGNITPVAEFNTYADAVATARLFALSSFTPSATLPPTTPRTTLPPYPANLPRPLRVVLCPLDITDQHELTSTYFAETMAPVVESGSPLGTWVRHFVGGAFDKIASILGSDTTAGLSLHDPMTVWYVLGASAEDPRWKLTEAEDIRIETAGQWSRGMHIVDHRGKLRPAQAAFRASADPCNDPEVLRLDAVDGDELGWLSVLRGNRIYRVVGTPGEEIFKEVLLQRVFGLVA